MVRSMAKVSAQATPMATQASGTRDTSPGPWVWALVRDDGVLVGTGVRDEQVVGVIAGEPGQRCGGVLTRRGPRREVTEVGGATRYLQDATGQSINTIVRTLRPLQQITIAEPFAGAGSTLLAAQQLGQAAVGVELDERYAEIAARRLERAATDLGLDVTAGAPTRRRRLSEESPRPDPG